MITLPQCMSYFKCVNFDAVTQNNKLLHLINTFN